MEIHTAVVYSDETSRMEIIVKCNSSSMLLREKNADCYPHVVADV